MQDVASQSATAIPVDILQLGREDSGPFQYSAFSATISLIDINYATSTNGFTANSISTNSMSLWGAEGQYDVQTGLFDTQTTTIGMDLVALFSGDIKPVPVPAAIWLFGSDLVGLAAVGRRRGTA